MPDSASLPDPMNSEADLRRFATWARRLRFLGRFLCRTTHTPAATPDAHGRPVVMVANHRSLADVFVAVIALDHFDLPARCFVRAKYFDTPVMGRWLTALSCIPAGDGKRGSVDTAVATLVAGRPVAIMIEGKIIPPERRDADGLGEFRAGFIEIARAANAVVMPITLLGTEDIWPSRAKFPRLPWRGRPHVRVHISETIAIDDLTDDEVLAQTRAAIADAITTL